MWFLTILETNISRYLAMSGNFLDFWGLKCALLSREIHVSRAPRLVWANFLCYQIFRILAAWKCDFSRFVNPSFEGTSQRVGILLIFEPENAFCPVVKSMLQGYQASSYQIFRMYQASCEKIFRILAAWKCDFYRFVEPRFKVPRKEWGNFLHLSCLKMRLCAVVKCTFQRHNASCVQIFRMYQTSAFWQPEYAISADSWNERFKVPRKDGGNFLNFWVSKKRISESWNPRLKGTKLHVNKFSTFW